MSQLPRQTGEEACTLIIFINGLMTFVRLAVAEVDISGPSNFAVSLLNILNKLLHRLVHYV